MSLILRSYMTEYRKTDPVQSLTRRTSYGQEVPPEEVGPVSDAASGFSHYLNMLHSVMEVNIEVGTDRAGNRWATVTVNSDSPVQLLEKAAANALHHAGLTGTSVTVNSSDVDTDELEFVFSAGTKPQPKPPTE